MKPSDTTIPSPRQTYAQAGNAVDCVDRRRALAGVAALLTDNAPGNAQSATCHAQLHVSFLLQEIITCST